MSSVSPGVGRRVDGRAADRRPAGAGRAGLMVELASLVGGLASVASTSSFVPQAWKIIRTREMKGISAGMYGLTAVGFALWFAFGLALGQWPLIFTNGVCLLLSGFILLMKMLPARKRNAVADAFDPSVAKA